MNSRMWKDGTRRGIVYVEERAAAEQVMALHCGGSGDNAAHVAEPADVLAAGRRAPRRRDTGAAVVAVPAAKAARPAKPGALAPAEAELSGPAMAVYLDRKGKPFAWQIPFALDDWDRVSVLVGVAAVPPPTAA